MTRTGRSVLAAILVAIVTSLVPAAGLPSPAAAGPAAAENFWVQNYRVTELWSGPSEAAVLFGRLRQWSYLQVVRAEGDRFFVFDPRSRNYAWVDAASVGPSGPPHPDYLAPPKVLDEIDLPGRTLGETAVYGEPALDDALYLRVIGHNTPLWISARVEHEGQQWYRTDHNEYVLVDDVQLPDQPFATFAGKWIDANLNAPVTVTAYEGRRAVYSALAIKGVASWQTPVGTFQILRRVPNETMSSAGLGIPPSAPGGYLVHNVLYTQYFTSYGAALHYNYWSSNFGYAGSHGCLGFNYADSLWFWEWAEVGTPIVIHY